jgi:hypothetical protein
MRTDLITRYSNTFSDNGINNLKNGKTQKSGEVNNSQSVNKNTDLNSVNVKSENYNNLISKSERQFFIKMFPDNAEQIMNHQLFNKNGRINTPNINKGSIVDGRV